MGYFTNNNYLTHGFYLGYKWVKPKGIYNNIYFNLNGAYIERFEPRMYQEFRLNGNLNGQLKNLWQIGVYGDYRQEKNDFYEARVAGWMVRQPSSWMKGFRVASNSNKKFAGSIQVYHRQSAQYNTSNLEVSAANSFRFNDRLSIGLSHFMEFHNRNFGFAAISENADSVFMSLRRIRTSENVFNVKYNFTNMMGITLRIRHYWSKVKYFDYMHLQQDGTVKPVASIGSNPDINVNLFNVDMNYTWQFAPGSFINVTWKTASELYDNLVMERYSRNLDKAVESPSYNSFSVKIIYFLDYLTIKARKARG